jgi:hypothetical protein
MKKVFVYTILLALVCITLAFRPPFKTSLTLTVRDEIGNVVEGASVKLFETKDDYLKEVNVAAETTTDAKGIAKFKGLKPVAYFIIVRKGDKDNAGGGEQIGRLEEGKFNKSTVVIQ